MTAHEQVGEPLPSSLVSIAPDTGEFEAVRERSLPTPREIRTREILGA